jgi:hypothetical protein
MKAVGVVPHRNGVADLVLDFHADMIGDREIPSRTTVEFAVRKRRRQHRRIHVQRRTRVVIVVGVNCSSIRQCRKSRRRFHWGTDHATTTWAQPD